MSLDNVLLCLAHLCILNHNTTSLVQHSKDSPHDPLWATDLNQVDWLEEARTGSQGSSVHDSSGSGDDLATITV